MTGKKPNRQQLVKLILASKLYSKRELEPILARYAGVEKAKMLIRALVADGHLTRFQAHMLLRGRTKGFIIGQYRILDSLGRGGMGRVFKAVHRTMSRVVALKVFTPHMLKPEIAQDLIQREVLAAARLQHPHIAAAYDASRQGRRYYLVMEYINGPNLEQLVQKRGAMRVPAACTLLRQVALGLQHAHEQGMVHRDIKPANILLQRPASKRAPFIAKLVDFGLARLQYAGADGQMIGTIVTSQGKVLGTPDYLSPEQARDLHLLDIRSDLYSLGCTLYYLLTAQVPFPGGSGVEKLLKHTREEPTPVEMIRQDVPTGVLNIVRKLMAKDPDARYQTPAELAAALVPWAAQGKSGHKRRRRREGASDKQSAAAAPFASDWPAHAPAGAAPLIERKPTLPAASGASPRLWLYLTGALFAVLVAVGLGYLLATM